MSIDVLHEAETARQRWPLRCIGNACRVLLAVTNDLFNVNICQKSSNQTVHPFQKTVTANKYPIY